MKCAVCVIVKKENDYLREFVEYHLALGYDTIFICDNNDPSVEQASDVVGDYVDSKQVVIIPTPNYKYAQRRAYTNCYNAYAQDYDWMSFIDADEFITLKQHKSIKDYLSEPYFDGYNVVQLNWMCYGDSGQIKRSDSRGVIERLSEPIMPLDYDENKFVKSTLRGRAQGAVKFKSAHYPTAETGRVCDSVGRERPVNCNVSDELQFEVAYIRHYITKTLEEYIVKVGSKNCFFTPKFRTRTRNILN
ncbi:MAG: glycosyltransferase family 2 protein [Rikenellaceae bacterium]